MPDYECILSIKTDIRIRKTFWKVQVFVSGGGGGALCTLSENHLQLPNVKTTTHGIEIFST